MGKSYEECPYNFLIDADGIIIRVYEDVRPAEHSANYERIGRGVRIFHMDYLNLVCDFGSREKQIYCPINSDK